MQRSLITNTVGWVNVVPSGMTLFDRGQMSGGVPHNGKIPIVSYPTRGQATRELRSAVKTF